jgi:hypothetical protein
VARLLDSADQRRGVALKLPACRGEHRARLVAHEQLAAELILQREDAGRDGGLADMKAVGGADEIAGADDREKRAGEFGIHPRLASSNERHRY